MENVFIFCVCYLRFLMKVEVAFTCKYSFSDIGMVCRGMHTQLILYFGHTKHHLLTFLEQDGLISPLRWLSFYSIITHIIIMLKFEITNNNIARLF